MAVVPSKFLLRTSLEATFSRLSRREKASFCAQIALSYLVGLIDLAGIAVFGLLALVATGGTLPGPLLHVARAAGLNVEDKASLLAFFAFLAMVTFLAKGVLSVWLMAGNARRLANLEKIKVVRYSSLLVNSPASRRNHFAEPEVAHALTVGLSALFTRTLGYLGIVVAEFMSVLSIIILLALYSPFVTAIAGIYFGLVGLMLQSPIGSRVERESANHAQAQVLSAQYLKEALYLYPELSLSGKLSGYIGKFGSVRIQALDALAKTLYLTSIPRYAVEAAFMVGAFGLAFYVFTQNDFSSAVAIFSVFIASGSRIAPSLITLMNASTSLRQVLPDVSQTLKVLKNIE